MYRWEKLGRIVLTQQTHIMRSFSSYNLLNRVRERMLHSRLEL